MLSFSPRPDIICILWKRTKSSKWVLSLRKQSAKDMVCCSELLSFMLENLLRLLSQLWQHHHFHRFVLKRHLRKGNRGNLILALSSMLSFLFDIKLCISFRVYIQNSSCLPTTHIYISSKLLHLFVLNVSLFMLWVSKSFN